MGATLRGRPGTAYNPGWALRVPIFRVGAARMAVSSASVLCEGSSGHADLASPYDYRTGRFWDSDNRHSVARRRSIICRDVCVTSGY